MSLSQTKKLLSSLVSDELQSSFGVKECVSFDRPKNADHRDLCCNVAFRLAKLVGKSSDEIAQQLMDALKKNPKFSSLCEKVEIARGYLNFTLTQSVKAEVLTDIFLQGDKYGALPSSANKDTTLIEFVSANPTGPLHVGHARQAILGDVLCNLLASQGRAVSREFYYNDEGVQIATLTKSVIARANGMSPGDAL